MDLSSPPVLIGALLVVNAVAFTQFGYDKRQAVVGGRRVPEATLLGWAMIGGTPGALLARRYFRHKTRKQPFSTILLLIAALQLGALAGIALALR